MVYNVIQQLQMYQCRGYDCVPVKQIQDVIEKQLNFDFIGDNDLFNLSLRREPRGTTSAKELTE